MLLSQQLRMHFTFRLRLGFATNSASLDSLRSRTVSLVPYHYSHIVEEYKDRQKRSPVTGI